MTARGAPRPALLRRETEELYFRRAAERLHMSQPPLASNPGRREGSRRDAAAAEPAQGRATAAVAAFPERAREILDAVEDAARQARRVQRGEVGRLAVGFVGSAMYSFVPELLRAFRGLAGHHAASARAGDDRAAAPARGRPTRRRLRPPPRVRPGLPSKPAGGAGRRGAARTCTRSRQRRWCASPTSRASRSSCSPRGSPGLRAALAAAIAPLGGEERIIEEVAEMQTVIGLVAAGVGISLVPESVRALARHGVAYRPLEGETPRCGWRWRGGKPTSRRCSRLPGGGARGGPRRRREGRRGPSAELTSPRPGEERCVPGPLRGGEPPNRREGMYDDPVIRPISSSRP